MGANSLFSDLVKFDNLERLESAWRDIIFDKSGVDDFIPMEFEVVRNEHFLKLKTTRN